MGQVKKQLTEDDYKLWSTMETDQLSENGGWVSYSLHYESGSDTLFVKNTKSLKTFSFAGGTGGRFATDNFFVYRGMNGDVVLTNLKSGKERRYSKISSYSIAMGGQLLIMLKNAGNTLGDLLVLDLEGTELIKLPAVSLYSLNPASTMLVCDSERKMHLLDLTKTNSVEMVDATERSYSSFAWQRNGLSLAYIAEDNLGTLVYYRLNERRLYTFDRSMFDNFPVKAEIYNASVTELSISDDGKRVFFGLNGKKSVVDSTGVQIWNTADKLVYPGKVELNGWDVRAKLAVWFPEKQHFRMVTDAQFPYQLLLPQQEYALVYNPLDNEPQFDSDAPIDYYLQNITTGQNQLLLVNHSADINKIGTSNSGKYVAYFRDTQWWVYNILLGVHRDLTSQTERTFTEDKYDRSGEEKVSGIAGWTTNDKELLVYDTYDIWLLKTDGSSAVRLTKGREQGIVYRVVSKSPYGATGSVANGVLNLKDGILLQAVSAHKSGYSFWSVKRGLQQIVFENNRIGWLKRSKNGAYCYIRENYHLAPQLVFQWRENKPTVLYQSNPHQKNYDWGFSKLISYENSKGQLLNGALYYPASYDGDKSYPMVVYIYERLSNSYNQYVNPSLLNQDGFNITNLITHGYFVLLPDIAYEESEPGKSAVDCVVNAVREAVSHESIDIKRIGLVGHSFGGYETNFIVTQTNLFAAAISGAGFVDFISSYLSVGANNKKQDCWRYEYSQIRMGAPLYDAYQKYLQNSPITFAGQVQTPLLLWAGVEDSAIDYRQSLELHLALRRLGKPNILLLYENGGHALTKTEHQTDLARRMMQWWDYYLKGLPKPDWFAADRL